MRIFIDIGHPAHVHLFKNFIWEMEKRGHKIKVTARDKDVTKQLLDAYQIPYESFGGLKYGKLNLLLEWIFRDIKILKIAIKFNPDILIGNLNPAIVHAAKILGKNSIIFTDTEPESVKYPIADLITTPLADVIITLDSVQHNYGKKEIRVNSYKELAYLHPNWFIPNPDVLRKAGLKEGENYVILRFVAWGAYHDVGKAGFSLEEKRRLIELLEPHARVFISSESKIPEEFEKYNIPVRPDEMHDFLYYAMILISDSQTMTTEAAVLGTPAIRCNNFVGKNDMGNFIELENKFQIIFNFTEFSEALPKINELLKYSQLKEEWNRRKITLLDEKIDLTAFFVWFIDNFPLSFHEMKEMHRNEF